MRKKEHFVQQGWIVIHLHAQLHNKRYKQCGGSSICEHTRERSKCTQCGGSNICEHNYIRSRCKPCGGRGSSICKHRLAVIPLRVNPSLGDVALSWHLQNHQFHFFLTPFPPDDKSHFAFFEIPIILFPDCRKDNQKYGCKRCSLFSFHSLSYLITMYGHDIQFKNDSFARQSVIQIHCETCTNRRSHFLSLSLATHHYGQITVEGCTP